MAKNANTRKGAAERRERFALEYVKDFNGAAAAKRAGYSKVRAKQTASRLLQELSVQELVRKFNTLVTQRVQLDAEFVKRGLMENALRCQQAEPVIDRRTGQATGEYQFDSAGSNRAFELLGKHMAMFTDKHQVSVDVNQVRAYVQRIAMIIDQEVGDAETKRRILQRIADDAARSADD